MMWQVQFLEAAQKDFERLDGSQKQETAKAICKVSQNPLPASEGGYGKPLGAHAAANLVRRSIKNQAEACRHPYRLQTGTRPRSHAYHRHRVAQRFCRI